ncbi:MAG TPA: NAD(P)-binding protein [Acidobacteriota bacterium]|jgi:spermidine dehydrogenase
MSQPVTRRDFLNASLLGAGSVLLHGLSPLELQAQKQSWDGYSGVGDYSGSNGNTQEVLQIAHRIRDGEFDQLPADIEDTGETFDLIIVGGGMSGLGAAHLFKKTKKPGQKCLLLENHRVFGGESKRNEFIVNGQRLIGPQGANEFDIPSNPGEPGYELYDELKIPRKFQYSNLASGLGPLHFDRTNYGFQLWVDQSPSFGHFFDSRSRGTKPRWIHNLWGQKLEGAPFSRQTKRDLLTWRTSSKRPYAGEDFQRWLDTMTYKEYLEKVMGLSSEVTKYADPVLAAALGLGSDALSAYAAYQISMPGFLGFTGKTYYPSKLEEISPDTWHSFPGGNDGFARFFVKSLIPRAIGGADNFEDVLNSRVNFGALDHPDNDTRIRLDATVVRVEHQDRPDRSDYVWITYVKSGRTFRLRGRAVVISAGGFMARRVVRDLPADYSMAYDAFYHSPVLVANVALRNWRFLYKLGLTACRWSSGFGFSCNIRQPMQVGQYRPSLDPNKPIILTFYVPFYYPGLPIQEQGNRGRLELLSNSYRDYELKIRRQMIRLFRSEGFNPGNDIAGIILNRWGHAYVNPAPGFYFNSGGGPAPRDVIRKRYGRIAFGHSELVGHQYWLGAIHEGERAAGQSAEIL